jgi:hypothetical protein
MPKPATLPTLYNDVLQINISKLKELGYLEANQIRSGTLHWSLNGTPIGSISIEVNTYCMTIELDYKFQNEPRNYKLNIIRTPSNLGKGEILYFLCPKTNKKCRILYSISGYFLHRKAFTGCMYESQIQSERNRSLFKLYEIHFKSENLYSELYRKNFKKTYAGKPTKKYLKIMSQIQKAEQVERISIEKLMLM